MLSYIQKQSTRYMSVQKTESSKKIFALVAGVMITAVVAGLVLFTGLI